MKWQSALCAAIENRDIVEILYEGKWRTFEPHLYGVNEADEYMVNGYCTKKQGSPGMSPGWRSYIDTKIEDLRPTGRRFHNARAGYSPLPSNFRRVIGKV